MECSKCTRECSSRRAIIRHIQTFHPEEIDDVKSYKKVKTLECHSCGAKFATRRSLLRHWRRFHYSATVGKTWDCCKCDKKYINKFSLYKHKQLCHPDSNEFVERQLTKIFECSNCGKKYSAKRSLRRHLLSFHPEEMAANMIYKPIACGICGKRYTRNTGYTLHMKRVHTGEALIKTSIGKVVGYDCPMCQIPFENKSTILQHFSQVHGVDVVTENMEFETRTAFDDWRTRVEQESRNNFSIRSSQSSGSYHSILYCCSRSGFHQSRSTGRRRIKIKGSRKINGWCPAEIRLKVGPDYRCQVQFTSTHVGHANELAHMRLNSRERESIVAALDANESVSDILHKFAAPTPAPAERTRLNVVRVHDVRNVLTKRGRQLKNSQNREVDENLEAERNESQSPAADDTISINDVQLWVNENSHMLLYGKCVDVEDPAEPSLDVDDFVFVIMTPAQRAKLVECGNEMVCVRRLYKPLAYRVHMTALLVRVPQGRSYACALLLSNRGDVIVYRMLLRYVSLQVPSLRPQILIGPIAEPFYEAWVQEMGCVPGRRLHCLREVRHTLKSRVKQHVKSVVAQKHLRSLLDQLVFAANADKFFCLLDVLKVRMENEPRLRQFFEEKFETCVERWAYCCAGVDAHIVMENFYVRIELTIPRPKEGGGGESAQKSDPQERNSVLLNLLMHVRTMIDRQEYKQLAREEWGEAETYLDKLRYRHRKTVLDFESVLADESGTQWLVMSATNDVDVDGNPICRVYAVEKLQTNCVNCNLRCWPCGACMHDYKCACPDAEQRGNMCCHIHLVCQYRMRSLLDGSQQAGMLVEEIVEECEDEPS